MENIVEYFNIILQYRIICILDPYHLAKLSHRPLTYYPVFGKTQPVVSDEAFESAVYGIKLGICMFTGFMTVWTFLTYI